MNRARVLALGVGIGLMVPALATAQTAFTTRTVHLRAGPDKEYPLVANIPAGVPVEVAGCVDDWTWCDVTVGPDRGWVYAGGLEYPYENRRVTVMSGGSYIGLPVVVYDPGMYWDTYYRARPWYGRRGHWVGRPMAHHGPAVIRPGGRAPFVRPEHRPVVRPEHRPVVRPEHRPVVRPEHRPAPQVERRPAQRPERRAEPQRRAAPERKKPEKERH